MHENINSRHTIFVVEEDDHARRSLMKHLRQFGYRLLVSADLEDAFEWTRGSEHIHADLVLVNLVGKLPEESLSIARRLREHCKYDGHTPIVILPERVPQNLEGTDEKVTDLEWICYYEDIKQLKRLLARLLNRSD
jgi:DNA-binding response OmpR family regulator